jgi:Tfp pilus assembly protein PilF
MQQTGDAKRALAEWETVLAIEPDSINARYNFALALKQVDFPHDAAAELEKVLEAKPSEARAHLTLANLTAQQLDDKRRARAHYMKLLELDPRNSQASAIRFWLAANP